MGENARAAHAVLEKNVFDGQDFCLFAWSVVSTINSEKESKTIEIEDFINNNNNNNNNDLMTVFLPGNSTSV